MLLMIPFWLLAMAVFWLPVGLIWGVRYFWFPLVWAAAGALLFVRPFQVAVLTPLFRARRPTARELAVIEPIWERVAAANDLSPRHFVVRILPADELNAFACGGHLVVVTSFAVDELSPEELAGVLAHELSHHLGLHTAALTVGHWLSIPVVVLARVGFFLQNVARAATDSFASHSLILTAIGRTTAAVLTVVSWVFLVALYAFDVLWNLLGRGSEYEADRRVVEMGYGPQLLLALGRIAEPDDGGPPLNWRQRLAASHPPATTRIARIRALLR